MKSYIMNHVTMKDVAQCAGVSQSTVSRVISNHPSITPETRECVHRAMRYLGYLAPKKWRANFQFMLLMCPLVEQQSPFQLPYFKEILCGVNSVARRNNCEILLSSLPPNATDIGMSQKRLALIAGIILLGFPHRKLLEDLRNRQLNFCICGVADDKLCEYDAIFHNDMEAYLMATRYLISNGYERFALFLFRPYAECLNGVRLEMLNHRLELAQADTYLVNNTDNSAFLAALESCLAKGNPPRALLVNYYQAAVAMKNLLNARKIRVPEDILIFTFANLPQEDIFPCANIQPRLVGLKAAQRLIEKLQFPEDPPHHIVIPMTFHNNGDKK